MIIRPLKIAWVFVALRDSCILDSTPIPCSKRKISVNTASRAILTRDHFIFLEAEVPNIEQMFIVHA